MKFAVTPELALVIRALRAQSGLAAKDVADCIGRSPSYLSKLENAEVKHIDRDVLTAIFEAMFPENDFFEDTLPLIGRTLYAVSGDKKTDPAMQVWFIHYDVVERRVDISSSMLAEISSIMNGVRISTKDLARLINSNVDSEMQDTFPANEFVRIVRNGTPTLLIRINVSAKELETILAGKTTSIPCYLLNAIMFILFKYANYPDCDGKMPPENAVVVLRCIATFMDKWGIHTLTGITHYMSSDEFISKQLQAISGEQDVISCIATRLSEVMQADSVMTIKELSGFQEMLQWDPAFALKLMGLPFSELKGMSFQKKKELLGRIEALLEEYADMPAIEKCIERY